MWIIYGICKKYRSKNIVEKYWNQVRVMATRNDEKEKILINTRKKKSQRAYCEYSTIYYLYVFKKSSNEY